MLLPSNAEAGSVPNFPAAPPAAPSSLQHPQLPTAPPMPCSILFLLEFIPETGQACQKHQTNPVTSPSTPLGEHICPAVSNHRHKVHTAFAPSTQRETPCSWGNGCMAKAADSPPQARSSRYLRPGHCFSQVRSKGFASFPFIIPPAHGKADAEKLNPSSIHECAVSCQRRMGYSFQALAARSKHACCSPPSDGLASPAAAPHSHWDPHPHSVGGQPPPVPVVGGRGEPRSGTRPSQGAGCSFGGKRQSRGAEFCLLKGAQGASSLQVNVGIPGK